ncbi:hypothetical protein EDM80_10940 [bacterium]|nr:MAG: hypothetical protein EDM80_10940 [bacterium]RIK60826.1 MAG: hypothetical protein DCC64_13885 [Planctomycetota bacterium]
MAKLADAKTLLQLDQHRRGRVDLAEVYDVTPWAALYSAVHHWGYPNNAIPPGKQSTFSYVFESDYDGLFIELSDFKAYVALYIVYTDVAGQEAAESHREELRLAAEKIVEVLRMPVDHFGALFDPVHATFTE